MQYPNVTWQGSVQPQIITVLLFISSTPDSNSCQSTQLWSLGRKAPCGLLPHDPKAPKACVCISLKGLAKSHFHVLSLLWQGKSMGQRRTHFFLSTAPSRLCTTLLLNNEWMIKWMKNEWMNYEDGYKHIIKWERINSVHSLSRKQWRKTKGSFWKMFLFLWVGRYACG